MKGQRRWEGEKEREDGRERKRRWEEEKQGEDE